MRQQAREKALQLDRLPTDFECAANEPVKNKEDEDNTDQSGFLRHYSHDEVGMSLGQIIELLDGTAESYAEEFTAAEGDERM